MQNKDFEAEMRKFEWLGKTQVPPESYIVLRLDGKGFSKFTAKHFKKPYDERMHKLMVKALRVLMRQFGAIYGYTESDEMSLVFPARFNLHDREVSKLVSISAGLVSSVFSLEFNKLGINPYDGDEESDSAHGFKFAVFDSRVWCSENKKNVVDYFQWRASDAMRCALNDRTYWTLVNSGLSKSKASRLMEGQRLKFKLDLLAQNGVDFDAVPMWQKRGVGVYWETYMKEGRNPKTGQTVQAPRRRLKVDYDLPLSRDYAAMVRNIIKASDKADDEAEAA